MNSFLELGKEQGTETDSSSTDKYKGYSVEDVSDLPKHFSWEQYIEPTYNQANCGSCYAIATANMLSIRLRIKFGEQVVLSPQHVLDCSYFN